jgi:hypothetical protein
MKKCVNRELEDACDEADDKRTTEAEEATKKPKQADILINVAKEGAPLFHTPDGIGYADIEVNGHRETCRYGRNRSSDGCDGASTKRPAAPRTARRYRPRSA